MIHYQLTPSYRVAVDYDTDAPLETPADCYDTLLYEVASCNNLDIHKGDPVVMGALEQVEGAVNDYAYAGYSSVGAALVKHLERNGYTAIYKTLLGQCPSDWIDCVIAVPNESGVDLDGAVNDWEHWYNGDYYTLALERRHVWHDSKGATLETWDTVDSLCGIALENTYDADEVERVTRDYFDVEEDA
nr:MAG TPA: hypothetical protein [Caudoviricetes sp.]